MTQKDFKIYFLDILDSIQKIESFISGMSYEDFEDDDKTLYAVIRAFEIIGEASKKISQEIQSTYPQIPWRSMAGMRDVLIHDYFGIDKEVVWKTITTDIPPLKLQIEEALEDFI